jgi:hypothetical protein
MRFYVVLIVMVTLARKQRWDCYIDRVWLLYISSLLIFRQGHFSSGYGLRPVTNVVIRERLFHVFRKTWLYVFYIYLAGRIWKAIGYVGFGRGPIQVGSRMAGNDLAVVSFAISGATAEGV